MKKALNEVDLKDLLERINKALDEGKVVVVLGKNIVFEPLVEDMRNPDSYSYLYINLSEESNLFESQLQVLLNGEFDGVMIDSIDDISEKDKDRKQQFVKAAFEKTFYSIDCTSAINFQGLRVLLSCAKWPEYLSRENDNCMALE